MIILAIQVVRRVTATVPKGEAMPWQGNASAAKAVRQRAATLDDLDSLVRYLPELASVPKETRQAILPDLTVLDVAAGEVLLRQGETDKHAFFVLKGRVVVEREEGGRHRITRSAGPGEQFGEVSALAGTPRMATAIAEEAARCCACRRTLCAS